MIQKYRVGNIAYLIESGRYIREGKITYICGDIITFKFTDCQRATKVKAHRLFPTEEAAMGYIDKSNPLTSNHLRAVMG